MNLTAERNEYKCAQMIIFELDDCELANLPRGLAQIWRGEGKISQRLEILSMVARAIEEYDARLRNIPIPAIASPALVPPPRR